MSTAIILQRVKFDKLALVFRYFKLTSGAVVFFVRYNEFFDKLDPFGVKLNSLNMKKLRESRTGLTFLRVLRRSAKDTYTKFTKQTETQFNLLHNEGLSIMLANSWDRDSSLVNTNLPIIGLTSGFQGEIFRKLSNYHVYAVRIHQLRNLSSAGFNLNGFNHSFFLRMHINSCLFYQRAVVFGRWH